MAVRNESVRFSAEDAYSGPVARMAAATALLNRELNSLSGHSASSSRASRSFASDLDDTARSINKTGADIDRYSGRLRLMGDALAILGPAAIPIGAAVVPAVAALSTQLGFAAVAGGSAVLAFQGVGAALKALDQYHLEPTAEHLQKLHETMQQLGPAGQDFVHSLAQLQPVLQQLEHTAQAGLFPGLTDALETIGTRGPQINAIVATVTSTLGDLASEAGDALAGPEWDGFFTMLERDGRPALEDMGHALGSVVHGLAGLTQAFLPVSLDFGSGLAKMAAEFDHWASSLSQTQGFQNFLDYLHQTGPQVLALLGSLGDALVQITQAAAPLGGPVLEGLTAAAKALASLADSPLGTPIFTAVAALSLYNRALAITARESGAAFGGPAVAKVRAYGGTLRTLGADLSTITTGLRGSAAEVTALNTASARTKQTLLGLGKGAAVIGGIAAVSTGAADKMGLTNTATLALAGSFAGAPGAAIGGGVGLFLDMRDAANKVNGAISQANTALAATGSYADQINQTAAAVANLKAQSADLSHHDNFFQSFGDGLKEIAGGDWVEKAKLLPVVGSYLNAVLGGGKSASDKLGDSLKSSTKHLNELQYAAGQAFFDGTSSAKRFAATMGQVSRQTIAAREAASAVAHQFVGLGASVNDSKVSLDGWIKEMAASARALTEFGNNAQKAADRGLRQGLIKALQEAGPEGAMRMAQLADGTQAEIRKANQAWSSGQRAIRKYTDAIGGVPNSVGTHLNLVGLTPAQRAIALIKAELASIPRTISTRYFVTQTTRINKLPGIPLPGERAAGGPIPKDGGPYADRFPYLLAPGEYVVSNRSGQADRYRPLLDLMNAGRLASGGPVPQIGTAASLGLPQIGTPAYLGTAAEMAALLLATQTAKNFADTLDVFTAGIHKSSKQLDLERSIRDKMRDELSKDRDALSSLRSTIADYQQQVASSLTTSPFGATVTMQGAPGQTYDVGGLAGFSATVAANIAKSRAMLAAEQTLIKEGFGKTSLFHDLLASGDVQTASELASLSKSDAQKYIDQYNLQNQLAQQAGKTAGGAVYGDQLRDALQAVAHDRATLKLLDGTIGQLNRRLDKIEGAVERGSEHGTRKGITEAASKGAQRSRNTPAGAH